MSQMVRVYNKGTRPLTWHRNRKDGSYVIHPGKFDVFHQDKAKEILGKYKDACTEEEFKSLKKASKKGEK